MSDVDVIIGLIGALKPNRGQARRNVIPELLEDFGLSIKGVVSPDGTYMRALIAEEDIPTVQEKIKRKCTLNKKLG